MLKEDKSVLIGVGVGVTLTLALYLLLGVSLGWSVIVGAPIGVIIGLITNEVMK